MGGGGGYTQGEAAYHHAFCQSHEDSIIKSRVKKHERIPVKKKKKRKKKKKKQRFAFSGNTQRECHLHKHEKKITLKVNLLIIMGSVSLTKTV